MPVSVVITGSRSAAGPEERRNNAGMRVIELSAEILADRRQLLYALTLPEYLEAWVAPPDANSTHVQTASRSGSAYAIEYCDLHGQAVTIEGTFRMATRDKVLLTWRRGVPCRPRQSLVMIRLSGNFAFTTLVVTHSGVMEESEYSWLREMWELSLVRLRLLMEGGRSRDRDDLSSRYIYKA